MNAWSAEDIKAGDVILAIRNHDVYIHGGGVSNTLLMAEKFNSEKGAIDCLKGSWALTKRECLNDLKSYEYVGNGDNVYAEYVERIELAKKLDKLSVWSHTHYGRYFTYADRSLNITDKAQAEALKAHLAKIKTELKKVRNYIQEHYYALYVGTLREWKHINILDTTGFTGRIYASGNAFTEAGITAGTILNIYTSNGQFEEHFNIVARVKSATKKMLTLTFANGLTGTLKAGKNLELTIDGSRMHFACVYVAGCGTEKQMQQYIDALAADKDNALNAISLYQNFFLSKDTFMQRCVFDYVARSTKINHDHRWLLGLSEYWRKGNLWDDYNVARINEILAVTQEVMDDAMSNLDRLNASVSEGYKLINKVYALEEN